MDLRIKTGEEAGRTIADMRKSAGLTQEKMAIQMQLKGCDMSRGTLAKVEAGLRHVTLGELRVMAAVLRTDYNHLLGYMPQQGKPRPRATPLRGGAPAVHG
nr:helix-turn-helix transcriptional regulator [bacterium]